MPATENAARDAAPRVADRFDVVLLPPGWRACAGVLHVGAAVGLLWCLLAGVLFNPEGIAPLVLARAVALLAAAPAAAAWLIGRAHRGVLRFDGDRLRLQGAQREVEVPCAAIAALEPAWLPWPLPAVALRLRSGRRLPLWIGTPDPAAVIARCGLDRPELATALASLPVVHARAAADARVRWWDRPAWKVVAFALLPTLPLFRVDQIISYGSWRGEYLMYGLAPYLTRFAVYWLTVTIYLAMLATVLRVVAEIAGWLATAAAPTRAASVRRLVEAGNRALYYGGVPVLLLLRFLPW